MFNKASNPKFESRNTLEFTYETYKKISSFFKLRWVLLTFNNISCTAVLFLVQILLFYSNNNLNISASVLCIMTDLLSNLPSK